jgi:hypothetical protein
MEQIDLNSAACLATSFCSRRIENSIPKGRLTTTILTAIKNPPQAPALLVRGDRRVSRKGFSPPKGETKVDEELLFV